MRSRRSTGSSRPPWRRCPANNIPGPELPCPDSSSPAPQAAANLIAALAAEGYETVSEAGRQIVAEQMIAQGDALPWRNQFAFMDLLFARSVAAFDTAGPAESRIIFFDRSFIEAIAYGEMIGRAVPEAMMLAARTRRFDEPVFVCPPWREIFTGDSERRHDFDFAVRDHEANVAAYRTAGYKLVEIPRMPVRDRVAFVRRIMADLRGLRPSNPAGNH